MYGMGPSLDRSPRAPGLHLSFVPQTAIFGRRNGGRRTTSRGLQVRRRRTFAVSSRLNHTSHDDVLQMYGRTRERATDRSARGTYGTHVGRRLRF